ncbi:MAG: hypothetical protein ABIV13_05495 [Fimbriimonadales bacterium]
MKKTLLLASIAAGLLALTAAGQDEVTLRRELKPGAKETYTVFTKVSQTMTPSDPNQAAMLGGEMKFAMSMTMDMGLEFQKVAEDKKSADAEMSFTNIVYDFGSMAGMIPVENMPKSMKASGKIDDRSRMSEFNMPDLPSSLAGSRGMMGPLMIALPEKAVKVGDVWEMPLPTAEMLGSKDAMMTAKVLVIEDFKGIPVVVVELFAAMPIDADLSEMAQASGGPPMKVLAKGRFDMKGKAHIERATGKTLMMDVTFDTKTHLTMPEVGIEFDTSGVGTSIIELVLPK